MKLSSRPCSSRPVRLPPARLDLFPTVAILLALILGAGGQQALAFVRPKPASLDPVVRPRVWIVETPLAADDPASGRSSEAASFRQEAGGSWEMPVDRRTGRAQLFSGSGIPMLPGAGNGLRASGMPPGTLSPDGRPTLSGAESLVRGFLSRHPALFLPDRGELVLNTGRSGVLQDGRLVTVDFDWLVDGVPVDGARVFARINSGNLIQAGTRLIGPIDTPSTPRVASREALSRALAHAGLTGEAETVIETGRLLFLPVAPAATRYDGPVGEGLDYRLVWEVAFRTGREIPTWTARVDAMTGEVIEFFDSNLYSGQVIGGVYPRTVTDPEVVWPLPFTTVLGGATIVTDVNGRFALPAGEISSGLNGQFFDTNCIGCSSPSQPGIIRLDGTGLLSFGTGGAGDEIGNGFSTRADRNAFYHLNTVRLLVTKWLSIPYLTTPISAVVNINDSCNAVYTGAVNFFRSSVACNNTGEIADVMQHEWGHGLDLSTAGGDGATGEGTADVVAMHMTHSPLVGPGFMKDGSPVRILDSSVDAKGVLTTANVTSLCPIGPFPLGPLGTEVHCEGELYGQTSWDLAGMLTAKHGPNTGWRESERIFFTSLPQASTYLPNQAGSIYDAYLAADDDDGNLANGTPNGAEIYTAFNAHGLASSTASSSTGCSRPVQPVVTATPGCDQISLSWNTVPGATSYRIQKHWQTQPSPFFQVASVTGTSYVDTEVTSGLAYHYVVQAVTAGGCESAIDTEVIASAMPRPRLDVSLVATDDTPAGNRSGTVDPGEAVDLTVTLLNAGDATASGVTDTLSSLTPGVTVSASSSGYPAIDPGQAIPGASAYRIDIPTSFSCGDPIDMTLALTAAGVCPVESNAIRIATGTPTPVVVDDTFETSSGGWIHDAATSTATAGAWVRGDPVGTNYQPEDDVTPTGVNAWYTGANPQGQDSIDDVDGGQVVLLSPVMDLTALPTVRLSYWRWFGQRDLGDDPTGDFFRFEVSNNGGSSWQTIDGLNDNQRAPFWTRREFVLEDLIAITANMRFRFRVSDGVKTGDSGDIIEAAIDDFLITGETCDTTPPCFVPATFGGLDTAAAGPNCGEIDLAWNPAFSNCQNAVISYDVYRSTDPAFIPSAATLIASSLTANSYRDSLLAPGATYHYIVRAFDSRSGEDPNTVRVSAVASTAADVVAPVFGGVASSASGAACGETGLSWQAAGESCSTPVIYHVYRSTDPLFTPSPSTLVAGTTSLVYDDAALLPGVSYTYIVRATDVLGNEDANTVRTTLPATVLPRFVSSEDFEAGDGGFTIGTPNDAVTGIWERGDPVGTGAQPEDDTTPDPGVACWVTGLSGPGLGDNDVDDGTTTLLSPVLDLTGIVDPTVRYQRWYSNDLGANPGTDTFIVQASNDGGASWVEFDSTLASSNAWVLREVPVSPVLPVTASMRFRFQAQDLPGAGSIVEAAIDDFEIIEPSGGCSGCPPPAPVDTIFLSRSGGDVVFDWSQDPVAAARYVVYQVTGPAFDQPIRIGTSATKGFTHQGALGFDQSCYYFVSAVDACGQESAFDTEP